VVLSVAASWVGSSYHLGYHGVDAGTGDAGAVNRNEAGGVVHMVHA
jgi:hypothetical protein